MLLPSHVGVCNKNFYVFPLWLSLDDHEWTWNKLVLCRFLVFVSHMVMWPHYCVMDLCIENFNRDFVAYVNLKWSCSCHYHNQFSQLAKPPSLVYFNFFSFSFKGKQTHSIFNFFSSCHSWYKHFSKQMLNNTMLLESGHWSVALWDV